MRKRFKKIYIEITNRCNLSCSFCPPTSRPGGFMSVSGFRRILHEIRPWTDYIYLHVKGEPLLHPQLDQILEAAGEENIYVNLTTNGTLLERRQEILLKYPVRQINISLHSFDQNRGHGKSPDPDAYLAGVVRFAKAFSPDHGITAFRLWNLPPDRSASGINDGNDRILAALAGAFHFHGSLDPRLYIQNDACLAPLTYLSFDREFQWPSLSAPDSGSRGGCLGLKSHIAVLWDGTVVPCCLDGDGILALGNIFRQPLEEILNSPKSLRIAQGFQQQTAVEPLCRRCGYRTRFF